MHTGFDAPPDSVEHACIVAGYQEYLNIRSKLKLPLLKTGALVTSWNQSEENLLSLSREVIELIFATGENLVVGFEK